MRAAGGSHPEARAACGRPTCDGTAVPPAAARGSTVPARPAPPPSSPNLRPPSSPSPLLAPLSPARPRSTRAPLGSQAPAAPVSAPLRPPPGAMGAPPGYRPSAWVHLLHQLPRADFQLRPVPSGFAPQEQEYQQVGAGTGAWGGVRGPELLPREKGLGDRFPCSLRVGAGLDFGVLREQALAVPLPEVPLGRVLATLSFLNRGALEPGAQSPRGGRGLGAFGFPGLRELPGKLASRVARGKGPSASEKMTLPSPLGSG